MIYIISHGRPYNQRTYEVLRQAGYGGTIIIVLDDEDDAIAQYRDRFADDPNVIIYVFNKQSIINTTDTGLITPHRNFAVFARNAVEEHARNSAYPMFWVFDDDIMSIRVRYRQGESLRSIKITKNLSSILNQFEQYLIDADICILGMGTTNNYVGGLSGVDKESSKFRMCYNAYLRHSKYTVKWSLNILEDRTTSIMQNRAGNVCLQFMGVQADTSPMSGVVDGGNSDVYRATTEFYRGFFSILVFPDCNYLKYTSRYGALTFIETAICPKIISSKYRKVV